MRVRLSLACVLLALPAFSVAAEGDCAARAAPPAQPAHPSDSALAPANSTPEQLRAWAFEQCRAKEDAPLVDCDCMSAQLNQRMVEKQAASQPVRYAVDALSLWKCSQTDESAVLQGLMQRCESRPAPAGVEKHAYCTCAAENGVRVFASSNRRANLAKLDQAALAACGKQ